MNPPPILNTESIQELKDFQAIIRKQKVQDVIFKYSTLLFAVLVLLVLVGIIVSLTHIAWPSIQKYGFSFFVSTDWDPNKQEFGGLIAIYGTLVTSIIALMIAVPVSFGIAVFLTEICPHALRKPIGICIELLAGIPSIIYGMWGFFFFAPFFEAHIQPVLKNTLGHVPGMGHLFSGPSNGGIGLLTAGVVLAIMVIPFIASIMRDVFEIVPPVLKESAYGIGCTRWEVIKNIVLPYTKSGVIGGIMLGLGRALGETMAVTFVIGNANRINSSLFAGGNSIASNLANQFAEADQPLHIASLFYQGLILFMITFVVLSLAKLMLLRMRKKEGIK